MSFMGINALPGSVDHTSQTAGVPNSPNNHPDHRHSTDRERPTTARNPEVEHPTSEKRSPSKNSTAVGTDDDDDAVENVDPALAMNRRSSMVQDLARVYTTQSYNTIAQQNPVAADKESPLNPASEHFNARAWAKSMAHLFQSSENRRSPALGFSFQNLNVYGFGQASDFQKDVVNVILSAKDLFSRVMGNRGKRIDILREFDGVVEKGEMLVVLGPPGSGCSTFLKTISGDFNGIYVDNGSQFNYHGISAKELHSHHRGEAIYTAEIDAHFPQLTVGETLTFASRARLPEKLPQDMNRWEFADHMRDVVMAMFGISHTFNTRVGNEFVRGVSGGERKRVTIAEAALSGSPLQCWDNSTRGLDSANAVEFCRTLRLQSEIFGHTSCVSIYQAPQSAYDLFDKVTVLYEGHQIFFGRADEARQYFIDLGFTCPDRATTPDFLTSMTSPLERIVRAGFEGIAPNTAEEFAVAWKKSAAYKKLQKEIEEYNARHVMDGPDAQDFRETRAAIQAKAQRKKSPYTLSYREQINLTLWRAYRRLVGDPSFTIGALIGNGIMALIISSIFYNLQDDTSSFFQRGSLLFFACLMNAFGSAIEVLTLFAQRPIVEKHARYALYHPSAEAFASMLMDMPYKMAYSILFNTVLYFMTNLRRDAGAFFFYLLCSFLTLIVMSMIFRTVASGSRTLSQAMVPAAIMILDLVIFTGFIIPIDYMPKWCRWLNYVDPLAYTFESMVINEFSGREFRCNQYVPTGLPIYSNIPDSSRVCTAVGSVPGSNGVSGDRYINMAYSYFHSHKWRNIGITCGFILFSLGTYLLAAEYVSEKRSKGEVLVFRRGHEPAILTDKKKLKNGGDVESGSAPAGLNPILSRAEKDGGAGFLQEQTSIFHWNNVCYDVQIKDETRRILDHVDGWVKPGTLTALMGVSGAGKTTLLDCLADRVQVGVLSGEMLVDGKLRDASFQRKTGYVQQQDLHLQTSTVREALNFSALLRQPREIPKKEKLAYVDEVIKLLDMEAYADAVIGVPGTGLNVEQRKRLTIGVELAAKPPLLLFVDEPTSGLDSQTSWAILDLLEKLTKSGQAVLCTIHQPSAMLFQRFDRLLFLQRGGKTVYFGEIGEHSHKMISYFERKSGQKCPPGANPAEWMLEVIGAAPGSVSDVDWFEEWRKSEEFEEVQEELNRLRADAKPETIKSVSTKSAEFEEFAAPFMVQLRVVLARVFQQLWRTPSYIYAKFALCVSVTLFVGLVFLNAQNTMQGMQNQMFAIFNLFTVFGQLAQQTMPHFVIQRDLYEVRERPSKVYSWKVFMLAQVFVELPWNSLMSVFMFISFYYPIGLQRNAGDDVAERGALFFLFIWVFMLFTATFTTMMIAGFETAEAGGQFTNLLFMLCLIFCGVLSSKDQFPHFWIFMYRVSPFTYLASGLLSVGVANAPITCAPPEYVKFNPIDGQTCFEYMEPYMKQFGGYLENGNATSDCAFCQMSETNAFLSAVYIDYGDRWRNWGLMWVYIIFNIFGALAMYYLVRVPKKSQMKKA